MGAIRNIKFDETLKLKSNLVYKFDGKSDFKIIFSDFKSLKQ